MKAKLVFVGAALVVPGVARVQMANLAYLAFYTG